MQDWADSFNLTYEEALLDLQTDIAAAWAALEGLSLPLTDRLMCILLYGESCTAFYGAANENDLCGEALLAKVNCYNPRIPPYALRLPKIVTDDSRMPQAGSFMIPRTD